MLCWYHLTKPAYGRRQFYKNYTRTRKTKALLKKYIRKYIFIYIRVKLLQERNVIIMPKGRGVLGYKSPAHTKL